jgi:hypothetical protein
MHIWINEQKKIKIKLKKFLSQGTSISIERDKQIIGEAINSVS